MVDNQQKDKLVENVNSDRPSWPYPIVFVLCVVIFLITPYTGASIGIVLFIALMAWFIWAAASKTKYEKIKGTYPSLSRQDYILNMLIFPVMVPVIIFLIIFYFKF